MLGYIRAQLLITAAIISYSTFFQWLQFLRSNLSSIALYLNVMSLNMGLSFSLSYFYLLQVCNDASWL